MGIERRERNGKVVYIARPHVNGRRLRGKSFDRERGAKAYLRVQDPVGTATPPTCGWPTM